MLKEEFLNKIENPSSIQKQHIDKIFLKKTVSIKDMSIIMSWSRYVSTKVLKDIKKNNPTNAGLSKTTITLSQFLEMFNEFV